MVLLAYAIAFLIGEEIRDRIYQGKKWKLYSGLFIVLKQHVWLSIETLSDIINCVYWHFRGIILGDVRTHV